MDAPGLDKFKIPIFKMKKKREYEQIESADDALRYLLFEPKANLKPLPTSEIHVKVDPEPIICIWVPKDLYPGQMTIVVVKLENILKESGWIPLIFPTNDLEVKVQAFSSTNIEKLDIEKLKEIIINEIKGE